MKLNAKRISSFFFLRNFDMWIDTYTQDSRIIFSDLYLSIHNHLDQLIPTGF